MPLAADAAGLGRITVYSALGQPLRAEVQLSASADELAGMSARLASPDAFRQANVDYVSTLSQLRFEVEKRASGAVVKLSSDRPINDPFLDVLLELNWPNGRLVREYTFLLDPPEITKQATYQPSGRQVMVPEPEPAEAPKPVAAAPALAPQNT
ncbi:MAG: pilus assembly protein, partial [Zoogloeaceae bacterium]|nr:pilus assembly protein [Zoogloeaceae bacterium]